jgi:hypothetical protein
MRAHRAALCVALLAAFVAGCSPFGRGRAGKISTGSVAPQQEEEAAPETAAPSLAAFEATDLATGLTCTGSYQPLENNPTFAAAVACDDGRTGKVTAARSPEFGGAGTLAFSDGTGGTVTLRRLAAAEVSAPPSATNQLPAPDQSAYVP